jgi:imidazolonepropionase-like amidohydrolase
MNYSQPKPLKKIIVTIFFSLSLLLNCVHNADSILGDNPYYHLDNFALINANLIDGTGSAAIPNVVIIIQDGYISDVGTKTAINIPPGTELIDLDDAYVLPGFINCHVHNAYNADNLKAWLQEGVTSVRDLGNFSHSPSQAFSKRDDLNQDNTNARLIAVGPMVTTINGYGNYEIASPEEAETEIEDLVNEGADLIKIAIEDNLQGRLWPMLTQEEVNTIAQTAHRLNKKVSAHISTSMHVNMAITGDVDDLAHMAIDVVPNSIITSVIEQDIYWVPTLELWKLVSERHHLIWDEIALDNLLRFNRAGGKVALGTDFGGYDVDFELGMPMVEMQLMKQAGMSPLEIILSATKNAAIVCDREDELGTIEVGKIADILVVNTNPLEDLQVLSNVQIVIHNGKIVKYQR